MDHYEELGLKRTATAQEIRHAYKVMARLVHPDGHADQQVREMAQRQMQRLNDMLATLTNEQTRREYDANLDRAPVADQPVVAPAAMSQEASPEGKRALRAVRPGKRPKQWEPWTAGLPGWARSAVQNGFWISLLLVLVCVGVWYMAEDNGSSARAGSAPAGKPVMKTRVPRQDVRKEPEMEKMTEPAIANDDATAGTKRPAAPAAPETPSVAEMPAAQSSARESGVTESAPDHSFATATQMAPSNPALATPKMAPVNEAPTFAGNWLYLQDPAESIAPGAYPATYVEFQLSDDFGRLSGSYRAHYRVADGAVSPEMSFQVQGVSPAGKSAHLRWTSQDGAKGEVDMALVGPNVMTVSWWSTELGRRATLASGTAILVRQRVR
jgi:DnaJ domain